MPDFGGARGGASGIVSDEVLEKYADVLLRESENWGIIELALGSTLSLEDGFDNGSASHSIGSKFYEKLFGKKQQREEDDEKPSYRPTEIYLSGYKPFCPYRVDLDFYKEARKNFNIHEWIDVVLSAVDYNPNGYTDAEGNVSEEKNCSSCGDFCPLLKKSKSYRARSERYR